MTARVRQCMRIVQELRRRHPCCGAPKGIEGENRDDLELRLNEIYYCLVSNMYIHNQNYYGSNTCSHHSEDVLQFCNRLGLRLIFRS
jgi:hypothetical protein